jgi:hypothetical protein
MAADIVVVHDASDFLDRATKKRPWRQVLFVATQLHDHFEHRGRDRMARRLNNIDAASATTEDLPCGDQLFPFTVVRVRRPAKAGANTPSSALAEETTYTGYENLGASGTRCSRPASRCW